MPTFSLAPLVRLYRCTVCSAIHNSLPECQQHMRDRHGVRRVRTRYRPDLSAAMGPGPSRN
jgi:hypothetical protein